MALLVSPVDTVEKLTLSASGNEFHESWKMITEPIPGVVLLLGVEHVD
jgi:hypothetical protein